MGQFARRIKVVQPAPDLRGMAQQIDSVLTDSATAVREDLNRLDTIIRDASSALQGSFEGLNGHSKSQESILGSLASELRSTDSNGMAQAVSELLEEIVARTQGNTAMAERFNDVSSQLGEIVSILKKLDQIAGQTKFLALNAMIEARRAGPAGTTFSVVADEVKTLSRDSAAFSEEIRTVVHASKEEIDGARDRVKSMSERDAALVSNSREQVEGMVANMGDLNSKLSGTLEQVTQISGAVSKLVAQAVRSLQFEDLVVQVLQHARAELERIDAVCLALGETAAALPSGDQPLDAGAIGTALQALAASLTQVGQRRRLAVQQSDVEEGDIELF